MNPTGAKKLITAIPGLTVVLIMLILSGITLWSMSRSAHVETEFSRETQKAKLLSNMRAALYAAAEAEKSAVLAESDELSQSNAKRARTSTEQVAAALAQYKRLVDGRSEEARRLLHFEEAFTEYRKVDEEVLNLAMQDTNIKAFALSFGPAAKALAKLEQTLRPSMDSRNKETALQATRALAGALRIQALHAAHIAERTEAHMDALEQRMAAADKEVRAALNMLGASRNQALADYAGYQKVSVEVVRLSRQNTNLRSLDMSLGRKMQVLAECDAALEELKAHLGESMAKTTK